MAPPPGSQVCVTGASGYIAAHIVLKCLERGYHVRGTVRDASNEAATAHLRALPGAAERLRLFSAELLQDGAYDEAVAGCQAVFHVASPLPSPQASEDPENLMIKPAVEGTLNILRACAKVPELSVLVLTSSMAAMAPVPEPEVKSEEHWSDPDGQRSRGSYYGASKTLAERAAHDFVAREGCKFRLVTICPTFVVGPMLQPKINVTMEMCLKWFKEGRSNGRCANDSMSLVDVRDCAEQHVRAMEDDNAKGRYMSLDASWHWNELHKLMKEIYPAMPDAEPCEGEPIRPTQFDRTRQNSLGVEIRKVPQILREAKDELVAKGFLTEP